MVSRSHSCLHFLYAQFWFIFQFSSSSLLFSFLSFHFFSVCLSSSLYFALFWLFVCLSNIAIYIYIYKFLCHFLREFSLVLSKDITVIPFTTTIELVLSMYAICVYVQITKIAGKNRCKRFIWCYVQDVLSCDKKLFYFISVNIITHFDLCLTTVLLMFVCVAFNRFGFTDAMWSELIWFNFILSQKQHNNIAHKG